tara:strand:+ start:11897 stop:13093 length:1197 start_codon:yes stop_codon:yes gene_type:complete
MDTQAVKHAIQHSGRYNRRGFESPTQRAKALGESYQSNLIAHIRENNFTYQEGRLKIQLAKSFGFCWGVERAVAMAYETRRHYPKETIWMTNEIIHNPSVNNHLSRMNVQIISAKNGIKDFSSVSHGDVVILPAFGATVQEMQLLHEKECHIIDTTCPWVSKVWHTVEKHKKHTFTSIIHGKYKHEETLATRSFAGNYLVVFDLAEAEYVSNYILGIGERDEFLKKFSKAFSNGFDPDIHLERVGVANQTTMLKSETEEIGKLFETTMLKKYGPANLNDHFLAFNTICDATEERQDAMFSLVDEDLDILVVIGGFNSSNTTHLQEIAITNNIESFHIDTPDRISVENNSICHKPLESDLILKKNFLPQGELTVGITSGASTPDKVVADVIEKLIKITS